ncbi:hypothetical protein, partial [Photobacterium sanctipauli]|uniref:hypothetical protein n=1 Tax=Photobacterium sanctipauli TaxID=1342794 RepID=UPI001C1E5E31
NICYISSWQSFCLNLNVGNLIAAFICKTAFLLGYIQRPFAFAALQRRLFLVDLLTNETLYRQASSHSKKAHLYYRKMLISTFNTADIIYLS